MSGDTNFMGGYLIKFGVLAAIATIGIPYYAIVLRPDLDYSFHLSSPETKTLTADNFSEKVENNILASANGLVDAERSIFIAGFSEGNLLVRLKDFPNSFSVHLGPDESLTKAMQRHYDSYRSKLSDAEQIKTAFGSRTPLTKFLAETENVLNQEQRFIGRMYDISDGKELRYKRHDDLGRSAKSVRWVVSEGETPSISGLMSSNAGFFTFIVGLAVVIGIPVLLMMLSSAKSKRLEKRARKAEGLQADSSNAGSSEAIGPMLRRMERIDSPANVRFLNQRLKEHLKTPAGRLVRENFTFPMWLRYLQMLVLVVFGLLALPTIVFTIGGLRFLWSAITLEPFNDLRGKEIDESLRIIVASMVIANQQILTGKVDQGPALLLGTFEADERFSLSIQSELASRLASIYLQGPTDPEEEEVYAILRDDEYRASRRQSVPSSIVGSANILLFDVEFSVRMAKIVNGNSVLVACVVDPREKGEIYQLPWSVIDDLVKDQPGDQPR